MDNLINWGNKLKSLIVFLIVLTLSLSAQTDSTQSVQYKQILMKDGEIFEGYLINQDSLNVVLKRIDSVVIKVPQRLIRRISDTEGIIVDTIFYKKDRNENRLYFAQTGKGLEAGEVSFNISEIFFPFVNIGITDFASISGGFSLFPTFEDQFYYVAPKLSFLNVGKISVSANGLYMNNYNNNKSGLGLAYISASATFPANSFTLGFGYSYDRDEISKSPFLIFGFEIKTGTSSKFISENWIISGDFPNLFSVGFRTFRSSLSWDFGFVIPVNEGRAAFIPWVGVGYNFNFVK